MRLVQESHGNFFLIIRYYTYHCRLFVEGETRLPGSASIRLKKSRQSNAGPGSVFASCRRPSVTALPPGDLLMADIGEMPAVSLLDRNA